MLKAFYPKIKIFLLKIYIAIFGKVCFRDKFGLRYFLWKDTRISSTVMRGARTDDTGVVHQIFKILDVLTKDKSGIVCFDVGAYLGVISLALASKIKGKGMVYSFEPVIYNYERILDNIKLNKDYKITAYNVAITDSAAAEAELIITKERSKSFIRKEGQGYEIPQDGKVRKIKTDTIDEFSGRNGISEIDILKIDTEDMEDKVLSGARNLLKSGSIYYLICEFEERFSSSAAAIPILQEYGYRVFFIVRNADYLVSGLKDYPFNKYKPPLNILAVSPKANFSFYKDN